MIEGQEDHSEYEDKRWTRTQMSWVENKTYEDIIGAINDTQERWGVCNEDIKKILEKIVKEL